MGIIQPHTAILICAMFAMGIVALQIGLRVRLRGSLEPLSRSTRWWVRGLVAAVIAALIGLGWLFAHVMQL